MKRRRELEVFSMSFLDAICCGFGSIILLFIISRNTEPIRLGHDAELRERQAREGLLEVAASRR